MRKSKMIQDPSKHHKCNHDNHEADYISQQWMVLSLGLSRQVLIHLLLGC